MKTLSKEDLEYLNEQSTFLYGLKSQIQAKGEVRLRADDLPRVKQLITTLTAFNLFLKSLEK